MNESKIRRQWAVRWPKVGQDKNGRDVYSDPVEIRVRWEDRVERDTSPITGEEVKVRATVYIGEVMELGDVLWLGLLVDSPRTPPVHNAIKIIREYPSKQGKIALRIVKL